MKKIVVALLAIVSLTFAAAGDLFISEYGEGSSNNKVLEIFNASAETVSLNDYAMASTANDPDVVGEYEYWTQFTTDAEIASGDVFVVCHPEADPIILAQSDMTHPYLSNGDDGYALVFGTEASYEVVDRVGDWQGDPGDGWNVAGVENATKDHVLVRKPTVTTGNPDWTASAGTTAEDSEWIVYDKDTFTYVGSHTMGGSSIENNSVASHLLLNNYPNPFNPSTTINYSLENAANVTVAVYNTAGEVVANLVSGNVAAGNHNISWNAGNLNSGVYFCQLTAGANVVTQKMILAK